MKKLFVPVLLGLIYCFSLTARAESPMVNAEPLAIRQVLISKEKALVYSNSILPIAEASKGEMFPYKATQTSEAAAGLFYQVTFNVQDAMVNVLDANIVNLDEEEMALEKYTEQIKSIKDVSKLSEELKNVKAIIANWPYTRPIEYQLLKITALANRNRSIYLSLEGKKQPYNDFYANTRGLLLEKLNTLKINKEKHAVLLSSIIPSNLDPNKNDLALARKAFDLYAGEESANALLKEMVKNPRQDDTVFVDKIKPLMTDTTNNYASLGKYLYGVKQYQKATEFLLQAEEMSGPNLSSGFGPADKALLAEVMSKAGNFTSAAVRYLDLEAKYGGYAFETAYNAEKAINEGAELTGIDKYKVLEIYQRANTAAGYFHAAQLYLELEIPKGAKTMAGILKTRYNEEAKANDITSQANKLESSLKNK